MAIVTVGVPMAIVTVGVPMAIVTVAAGACAGCGACLLTCPQHALRPVPAGLQVRADRCTGCLECLEVCPVSAISVGPELIRSGDTAEGAE